MFQWDSNSWFTGASRTLLFLHFRKPDHNGIFLELLLVDLPTPIHVLFATAEICLVLVAKADLALDFFFSCRFSSWVNIYPFYCAYIVNFLGVCAFSLQIYRSNTVVLWDTSTKEFLQDFLDLAWSDPLGVNGNLKISPCGALCFSLAFLFSSLLISLEPLCFYLCCLQQWCFELCFCRFFMWNWKKC